MQNGEVSNGEVSGSEATDSEISSDISFQTVVIPYPENEESTFEIGYSEATRQYYLRGQLPNRIDAAGPDDPSILWEPVWAGWPYYETPSGNLIISYEKGFGLFDAQGNGLTESLWYLIAPMYKNNEGYCIMCNGSKYGILDPTGKMVVDPQYDLILGYGDDTVSYIEGTKYGYLSMDGKVLIPAQYDLPLDYESAVKNQIDRYINRYSPVPVDERYDAYPYLANKIFRVKLLTFLEPTLGPLTDYREHQHRFVNGTALLDSGNVINKKGDVIVEITPYVYSYAQYSNGYTVQYFTLDLSAKEILENEPAVPGDFDSIDKSIKAEFAMEKDHRLVLYDNTGKKVFEDQNCDLEFIPELKNKFRVIYGKYSHPPEEDYGSFYMSGIGMIDSTGAVIAEPLYRRIGEFSDGIAVVSSHEMEYGYLSSNGSILVEPEWEFAYPFADGMGKVRSENKRIGYYNQSGELVIPPRFLEGSNDFSEGLAAVIEEDGKAIYIDQQGNRMFNQKWDRTYPFEGGVAVVMKYDESGQELNGLINHEGEFILPIQYTWLSLMEFTDDSSREEIQYYCAEIKNAEGNLVTGCYNKNGVEIIAPQYDDLRYLGHDQFRAYKGEERLLVTITYQ